MSITGRCVFCVAMFVAVPISMSAEGAAPGELKQYAAALERNLHESVVAFWLPRSIDEEHGGYQINFDIHGDPNGKTTKGLVTQARMLWFWSHMARAGADGPKFKRPDYLAAAKHGYRFLHRRLRDAEHGGYFWEVDQRGVEPLRPNKHLYGQAFALYALSEYHLATGNKQALELAHQLFATLERRAHDRRHGGYHEYFTPDWKPVPPDEPVYMGLAGVKLMNTHLHLLEAMTTYFLACEHSGVGTRLAELMEIQSNTVVRKADGFCTDKYRTDWTPMLDPPHNVVSYGHDIENVWLLMDARRALDLPQAPLVDLYHTLWDYSIEYGLDRDNGGLYYTGPFHAAATDRDKSWWVQAEVLVSALRMHELTGNPRYAEIFEETWRFVDEKMTDHEHGGWYATVKPDGSVSGDKANLWKSAYHNGRALLEALEILER
ncbi:MAG: AGE family epimerase/isomerase [Planctomycetota bacterium]